jgi:hypothetical protein
MKQVAQKSSEHQVEFESRTIYHIHILDGFFSSHRSIGNSMARKSPMWVFDQRTASRSHAVIFKVRVCVYRGAEITIIGGADIHIFVFCPINFFWNRLFLQSVNTNTWISAPPPPHNYRYSGASVYICVWRYPVNFSVHYNIHYITFTILLRETWNDYPFFTPPQALHVGITCFP